MDDPLDTYTPLRESMVEHHIIARGIKSALVLKAMRRVKREAFVPEKLREFAYEDSPLPIDENQTISQPYIVALMIDALDLKGNEKVLEIGAGSGYAAAVIGQIASEVYTVERLKSLADKAANTISEQGYHNIHVRHGDGSNGWQEHAPYDAIVVAAGGPSVPESLKAQLKIGGRLVIPVGDNPHIQELVRVIRRSEDDFETEDIADVRFVPLVGKEGWPSAEETSSSTQQSRSDHTHSATLIEDISEHAEPFSSIDECDLEPILERIGDARVVLIGEASHGTAEFYRFRAKLTKALIERKHFDALTIEGDWPDAVHIDHYVRHFEYPPAEWVAFARFPTWMWRNEEVREFVDWLRLHNTELHSDLRVAFYGLDLYSLYNSIESILQYLDSVDPQAAATARQRYGCLTPWQSDPASYGRAATSGHYRTCEEEVVKMLRLILDRQANYSVQDGDRFMDAMQNARLVTNAERYYRVMYYGSRESWNLRDKHMFDTLKTLLEYRGPFSKAIVWAHNSHVGDAAATEMSARGEFNIGQLCRQAFGDDVYSIGFGTDHGTVAAATDWGGRMEVKTVQAALPGSYESLCHDVAYDNFFLPLKSFRSGDENSGLLAPRLERAIGVLYRPETERASHYFQAVLPLQFDEYIWLDATNAVEPIKTELLAGLPDTYPFGI